MNELALNELALNKRVVNWRNLLLIASVLALTSSAPAMAEVQVTFPESGPHWCWLRSAAGPVTAGPVEATGASLMLHVSAGPGDTVTALAPRTGRLATQALTFAPDGTPRRVRFTEVDFQSSSVPPLVPALAGLSAALAGLLLWQTRRGRPSSMPASGEPDEDVSPQTARGPGLPLTPSPAATSAVTLVGIQGLVAGGTFALTTGDVRVGRDGDNDIVLAENLVSRHHARLRRDAQGRFVLTDLGSANGVYVNGMRVARACLTAGDEIKIGDNFFRFHVEERTEPTTQEKLP